MENKEFNLEELLKKPLSELKKEEVDFIFANLDWNGLLQQYINQQKELQRLAENN